MNGLGNTDLKRRFDVVTGKELAVGSGVMGRRVGVRLRTG